MAIRDALLPEFDQEVANTRKVLALVPDADAGWQPHPKSFSMGDLSLHVANLLGWGVSTMTATEFDMAPAGGPRWSPPVFASAGAMREHFESNVAAARAAIAGASDADFMVPWSLKNGGKTLFTMPRAAVLRSFVFNHIVHHRGQLTLYLRLRNIPVPGLYGPSADEK